MAMLGNAALAMWWDMAPAMRPDFEDWHAHEHFPERLGIPGFRRASRWSCAEGGEGVFVLYELEDFSVLSSPGYAARLNAPTPWSTRMMPHHRHMVRSQCRVLGSEGAVTARQALTVRLSPAPGQEAALRDALGRLGRELRLRPGLVGLHVIRHEAPPIAPTEEQRMRGLADRFADWVLIACGYDAQAVQALAQAELCADALQVLGAQEGAVHQRFALAYSATPGDVR
ncbi:MAG: hypothetical protein ACLGJD_10505 [Gammaproteobacteria bacterium]|jgi:hypothetical protein|uniref:hypothetical protein n=1 Tax=Pseudacidovorax sp. TaxID=1934311 RepID=UPI001B57D93A|nr:hypothetical protein [Pseudacidovorax sp.]MBP6896002.1 hypothetical protein [Pseudacidovorax sp.]